MRGHRRGSASVSTVCRAGAGGGAEGGGRAPRRSHSACCVGPVPLALLCPLPPPPCPASSFQRLPCVGDVESSCSLLPLCASPGRTDAPISVVIVVRPDWRFAGVALSRPTESTCYVSIQGRLQSAFADLVTRSPCMRAGLHLGPTYSMYGRKRFL